MLCFEDWIAGLLVVDCVDRRRLALVSLVGRTEIRTQCGVVDVPADC